MCWKDSHAASQPLAVVIAVGMVAVLGGGLWLIVGPLSNNDLETQYSVPNVQRSSDGSSLYATLVAGEVVPLDDARIHVGVDGAWDAFPMTVFAPYVTDGENWRAGDRLCIVGQTNGCLIDTGGTATMQIVVGDTLIWEGVWILNPWDIADDGSLVARCAGPVSVQVLGTSITYGLGGPDIPIRVDLNDGGGFVPLFADLPVSGGEIHTIAWTEVGSTFQVQGRADYLTFHASYASGEGDEHVLVLKDGDEVPDIPAYGNQAGIEAFLEPYIDVGSGTVSLDNSEAILLFEFTSNTASAAADWQDLVVLFDFEGGLCDAA